jgi:hypothetical protein
MPAGKTATGTWGAIVGEVVAGQETAEPESFPIRAPHPLDEAHVSIGLNGANGQPSLAIAQAARDQDEDASCAGTFLAPTAPPGRLCVYVRDAVLTNVGPGTLAVFPLEADPSPANVYGFLWIFEAAIPASSARAEGTWAYTAPL